MANRLAGESSPYLRQHAENPVDWYPWGAEALARARDEDRPLLVSIGYSACHWCHVMAHESFEDPATAAVMNEHFVCVKVDREERPDVDAMCMEACQAMTGSGGWPLNAFLTPELVPFFAGTYFPPESRQGMPSWRMVLLAVADAWRDRREEIAGQGAQIVSSLGATARLEPSPEPGQRLVGLVAVDLDRGGAASNERTIVSNVPGVPGGIRTDEKGNLWVAGKQVYLYSSAGKLMHEIPLGETPSNLAFGDPDSSTLYVTAHTKVYRMRPGVKGALQY